MTPYVTRENLAEKTELWLEKIAQVNPRRWDVRPSQATLLVLDMQNYFLTPGAPHFSVGGYAVIPNILRLIESFRAIGRPVIFTRHEHQPTNLEKDVMQAWWGEVILAGSDEADLAPEFTPQAEEAVIVKNRYSAFYDTNLEVVLQENGVTDIVIAGVKTNLCCESTARDAYFRGYRIFFTADATGTGNEEMHLASLQNLAYGFASVVRTSDLLGQLRTK
jgi:nicotinamidase-related amidase